MKLITFKNAFLLILLFTLTCFVNVFSQDTFADTFSVIAYNQNNGTENWSTNWIETGDDGSAVNPGDFNDRRMYINNGQVGFNLNQVLFIDLDGGTLERGADLSTYGGAVLTLDFDSRFRGTETLIVEFFNDITGLFETATTINTSEISSLEYSLTVDQISANSRVRFRGGDNNWPNNQGIFIDNVQITAYDTSIAVDNITVNESDGTATFTATYYGNSFAGTRTVDFITTDNTAFTDSDFTTNLGTLTFSDIDRTETITVPIIDNNFAEGNETFFITLSNPSVPGMLLVNGIGTIVDDAGDSPIPIDAPLVLFERFNGYFDYTSTGSTFRDDGTDTCSITTTSSNQLTSDISAGGTVTKAYLIWTHSGSNADDVVTFEGQTIEADLINKAIFQTDRQFHSMLSDVTTLIQSIPNLNTNVFDLTDLNIDNTGSHCANNTTLGGWSLFIFYNDPVLPASSINFYHGFDGEFGGTTNYTLDGFYAIGTTDAKTTVLSWEGDDGLGADELLSVTTSSGINTLNGDGSNTGGTSNPFNSTIFDNTDTLVNISNTYGIDLDTYDISPFISPGDSTATTNVEVDDDYVILNSVLLKVPSNLIIGNVFEDINYGGGNGRNQTTSGGIGLENVTVELFRENPVGSGTYVFEDSTTTDASGEYVFGGMANGTYRIKVISNTVRSSRVGGNTCITCLPVQTFRRDYSTTTDTFTDIVNEVGGADPSTTDITVIETLAGSQTVSDLTIDSEGIIGMDFGFNFNTIVNTNEDEQGSLEQFIINSNNLGEIGLDIEAHPNDASINPAAGEDTSIFNIPITDSGYIAADGYFDILINNELTTITDNFTVIDGRTQTALTGDTNAGTVGASSSAVGVNATTLPNYSQPEIQVQGDSSSDFAFDINASNITIRNLAIYGDSNGYSGIEINSGSDILITENLIGSDANGNLVSNLQFGIEVINGNATIESNYLTNTDEGGVTIANSTAVTITNNHFEDNGRSECRDAIEIEGGTGILIQNNFIENSGEYGINNANSNDVTISQNTISGTGNSICNGDNPAGIRLVTSNTTVTGNIINNNGETGIYLTGTGTSNRISQNSIFANGVNTPGLGIDFFQDGLTENDPGDTNIAYNFPVFESVTISGTNLKLVGWARPGSIIEVFLSDIATGTANPGDNTVGTASRDYGEGQTYLGTITEGSGLDTDGTSSLYSDVDTNTDNTTRFNITLNLSAPIPFGSLITATATDAATNTTSEFGSLIEVRQTTVITNRRITYRIRPN